MTITQVSTNMAIVAALADLPNATSGLTAAQLKAKFDEGGTALKTYINGTLIPALEAITAGASGAHQIGSAPITGVTGATVYAQLVALKAVIDAAIVGQIPDGTLAYVKWDTATKDMIARRAQEAFITATLLSGWTGTVQYAKNDLGLVTVTFNVTSGTITGITNIVTLPAGYRPTITSVINLRNFLNGNAERFNIFVNVNGAVNLAGDSAFITATQYVGEITFYAAN